MRRIPPTVIFLGLVSLFNDIASEMIYPIVPIFLTTVLHAPVSIIGFIEGIAEATASLGKFLFGYLSDKIKKRKIFVVGGYSFSALSKLLIGLATGWPFVLFARFIDRLGKGIRTSARDSILLQNTRADNKGFIFGFHRSFDSAGAVLGPVLALVLMNLLHENLRTIFFIAFVPSLIGVLLLIIFVKEKKHNMFFQKGDASEKREEFCGKAMLFEHAHGPEHHESAGGGGVERIWEVRKKVMADLSKIPWHTFHPSLKLFFLVSIIFALGNSSDAFLILRSKDLGLTTTLTVATYMLYNLSQTIFAAPLGSLADRIGARRVFGLGLLVFAAVYFLFGIIKTSVFLWFLFPVYGLYIAATDGVSKAYISEFITERQSGTYFGLYQTSIAVASFFASFIAGLLWSKIGPQAAFFYGSLMAISAFLVLGYGNIVRKV